MMNEFFANEPVCLFIYLIVVVLMITSVGLRHEKKYFLMAALLLYVADISALLVFGFGLQHAAMTTGILLMIALISVKAGDEHEL